MWAPTTAPGTPLGQHAQAQAAPLQGGMPAATPAGTMFPPTMGGPPIPPTASVPFHQIPPEQVYHMYHAMFPGSSPPPPPPMPPGMPPAMPGGMTQMAVGGPGQTQTPFRNAMNAPGKGSPMDPSYLPANTGAHLYGQFPPSAAAEPKATPLQTTYVGITPELAANPVVWPRYEDLKGYKGKGTPGPPGTMPPLGGVGVAAPPKSAAMNAPGKGGMAADAPDVESARGSKRIRRPSSSGSGSETPRIPLSSDGAADRFIKLM